MEEVRGQGWLGLEFTSVAFDESQEQYSLIQRNLSFIRRSKNAVPHLLDNAAVPPSISPVAFSALDEYSYGE